MSGKGSSNSLGDPLDCMRSQASAPAGETSPVRRVVVPVQGTDREYIAQEHAIMLAAALGATVRAVHVQDGTEERTDDVFAWLRKHADMHGVEVDAQVMDGSDPATILVEELDALDLVVIGSRRLGGRYHVGSVAERLIRDAPCPVQVVRLPG